MNRVAPLVFEFVLLLLTGAKCVAGARRAGWLRAPLLALLFRDGLWAFLLVFGASILCPLPFTLRSADGSVQCVLYLTALWA